jgi:hypothetical protein
VRIGSQVVFTEKQYCNTTLCKHEEIKHFGTNTSLSRIKRLVKETMAFKNDAQQSRYMAAIEPGSPRKIGENQGIGGKRGK